MTPLVSMMFDALPYILDESFSVSTLVSDSMVVKRVYKVRPISLPSRVTLLDLIEHDMLDFCVILGKD